MVASLRLTLFLVCFLSACAAGSAQTIVVSRSQTLNGLEPQLPPSIVISRAHTLNGLLGTSVPTIVVSRAATLRGAQASCPPLAELCVASSGTALSVSWIPNCEHEEVRILILSNGVPIVDVAVQPDAESFVSGSLASGPYQVQVSAICTAGSQSIVTTNVCHLCDEFLRGDCNGDGTLNIVDAVCLLGYLFNREPADCLDALDVNDDGEIDVSDPVGLLSYLFNNGALPPPPSPTVGCGPDPTPDCLGCAVPQPQCP